MLRRSGFSIDGFTRYSQLGLRSPDALVLLFLGITFGFLSYYTASLLDPFIFHLDSLDMWFDADIARVYSNMTQRWSNHGRGRVHPLFSLMTLPAVYTLTKTLNLEPLTAVRVFMAALASLWISGTYILLRAFGCRLLDSIVFTLLAGSSAAFMFDFIIPETFSLGSITILGALIHAAVAEHRMLPPWSYSLVSALTLSAVTTNWMVGIFTTLIRHPWRLSVQITANAFCIVVILWGVQHFIIPSSGFFLVDLASESRHSVVLSAQRVLTVLAAFWSHSMVMPAIGTRDLMLTAQDSLPGSGSLWGLIACGTWMVLVSLGIWSLLSLRQYIHLKKLLALILVGQLALHMIYGRETFVYSLHFLPIFVMLVSMATLTPARSLAIALAVIFTVTAAVNNFKQLKAGVDYVKYYGTLGFDVQRQMIERPKDLWPRGTGQVVLTRVSNPELTAYHEPGGAFSPAAKSFGVSFWINDIEGGLNTSSSTIPLWEIRELMTWSNQELVPGILTETKYYNALWSSNSRGQWSLQLKPQSNQKLKVVIRRPGPSGGPIRELAWNGQTLTINSRWMITLPSSPGAVYLGEEGGVDWKTKISTATRWVSEHGWGYARFELGESNEFKMTIQELSSLSSDVKHVTACTTSVFEDQREWDNLSRQMLVKTRGDVLPEVRLSCH